MTHDGIRIVHGRPVTRTGLVIGGAYVPPPMPLGSDAVRVQGVLLARRNRVPLLVRVWHYLTRPA